MDDQEINVTIAEWQGWKWYQCDDLKSTVFTDSLPNSAIYNWKETVRPQNWRNIAHYGPKYCTDLNAIQGASGNLNLDQKCKMANMLMQIEAKPYEDLGAIFANAYARSKSFLKAVELWKE